MKLAIVGSRVLAGNEEAQKLIESAIRQFKPLIVVSGGADGIDSMAAAEARTQGIDVQEFLPEVMNWELGFKPRNMLIAQHCDALVCIAAKSATTCGSGWTARYAESIGKIVCFLEVDDLPKSPQQSLFEAIPELQ